MSTYQKSLIDEARPDEGNSLLPSETRKDKKPMELNQRLLKAVAVLFVASCALSYAIRGSNKTFSEAFLVSSQSTETNMLASFEPNTNPKGYVTYHHKRCANPYHIVIWTKKKSEEACAKACLKHPKDPDICSNTYFSYDNRSGKCFHFDGVGDCEPNDDWGFDSFKFVEYGKCDIDDELKFKVSASDTLYDCQKLCTRIDECKAHQWSDDKCIMYSKSVDSITNDVAGPGDGSEPVAVAVCQNKETSYASWPGIRDNRRDAATTAATTTARATPIA